MNELDDELDSPCFRTLSFRFLYLPNKIRCFLKVEIKCLLSQAIWKIDEAHPQRAQRRRATFSNTCPKRKSYFFISRDWTYVNKHQDLYCNTPCCKIVHSTLLNRLKTNDYKYNIKKRIKLNEIGGEKTQNLIKFGILFMALEFRVQDTQTFKKKKKEILKFVHSQVCIFSPQTPRSLFPL